MKIRFLWSIALLSVLGAAGAQDAGTVAPELAAPELATPRMEPLVVSGRQPGPGLWRVSKDDHDLWIVGTLSPLPKRMQWESGKVQRLVTQAQELLAEPSVTVNAKLGFFSRLALIPTALRARNDPDGRSLQQQLPPETWRRWLVLKKRYIGRSRSLEKRRPILAADALFDEALDDNDLSRKDRVWPVLRKAAKKAKVPITAPRVTIEISDPKKTFREMAKAPIDDVACFEATLDRLETDMGGMKARANAWAVGDVATLIALPHIDEERACVAAVLTTEIAAQQGASDLPEQLRRRWLQAAEAALAKNALTVAALPIESLLREDGPLAALRARGYTVVAPM